MKILDNLLPRFNGYMTYLGRAKARDVLLRSSDRMLEDAGFSRELLESGVSAWPWHAPVLTPLELNQAGNVAAMRKRQACSEKQLHEPDLSRDLIPEAVRFDQDGIDNKGERNVA